MNPARYYLPDGYQENLVRSTMDKDSGGVYWSARRLADAANYQYAVYRRAIDLIRAKRLKSVVDVGCGPAVKLAMLHEECPEAAVTGIDQEHPIAFCRDSYKFGVWHVDDFENPSPELGSIQGDLVICCDVIEHVINPDKLVSYLKDRTKPGGYVLISTPDRDRHYGREFMRSGHKDHVREWNFEEFASYLRSRGVEILDHRHLPGMRAGFNMAFLYAIIYHFKDKRPQQFNFNQVVLGRFPDNGKDA